MKRLAIDMDGVLADVYPNYIKKYKEETGKVLSIKEVEGLSEYDAFPGLRKYITTPGFFRELTVIEGSREAVKKLNERYKIFIVSAAMEFPLSLNEKQKWLNEHFPFITWQQMVLCGSKEIIAADIMIDDHFKNLDSCSGQTLLYTQPHNKLTDAGKHTRVNSWEEIEKILSPT